MKADPKHRLISETLRQEIASGKYNPAKRLPSEMELARRFKVSRPTAARALRDLQKLNLIDRRIGSGTYLKRNNREGVLGLLVPGLGDTEILDPICNEITRFGQGNGFTVLWGNSSSADSAKEAQELCYQFIDRKVAGVFFTPLESVPQREEVNCQIVSLLSDGDIAIVLLDRDLLEFPNRSSFDLVGIDNFHAGLILTEHLIGLGCRNFLFLARPNYPATSNQRLAGCREAAMRAGLHSPRAQVGEPNDVEFVREMLRPNMPDAIVCSNDRTAALLIQTLFTLGIRLPQDIRVVGFDDLKYATLLPVPLTTIRQPYRDIGQTAVRTMQERINDPTLPARQILLPVELVIRQSCGSKNSGS